MTELFIFPRRVRVFSDDKRTYDVRWTAPFTRVVKHTRMDYEDIPWWIIVFGPIGWIIVIASIMVSKRVPVDVYEIVK